MNDDDDDDKMCLDECNQKYKPMKNRRGRCNLNREKETENNITPKKRE